MVEGSATVRIFGNYDLQRLLGRGGMAEVWRAQEIGGQHTGRTVAIKRLLPALTSDAHYVRMFVDEARLSRMLHHPNIVEVYDAGKVGEQYFMCMEFIDGNDLGQVLRRCRERKILLPVDFAVFLGVALLDALAYAHSATSPQGKHLGIVHCDISPSNLFISRTGEIKLGDFGIAKAKTRPDEALVLGKPYYLSPEALGGVVDGAADLWAAAATLYELLLNERPFPGANPDEVAAAIRKASPRPPRSLRPEVSEQLEAVVLRGFALDPADRYPSPSHFAAVLRPHYNELIGNRMAIAAVIRGLFGS